MRSEKKFPWLWILGLLLLVGWLWIVAHAMGWAAAPKPKEPMMTIPGYQVGEFVEPPVKVLTALGGKRTVLLRRWDDPTVTIIASVEALKLVAPYARRTKLGLCAGNKAYAIGLKGTRNRAFYRQPRVACAAFTAFCYRHCGRPGLSFSATQQYSQVRRRGGRLVASRVSTRYVPFYRYIQKGDLIFFHKGNRMGHVEISAGGGWVVGTSSSAGRVGRRRLGNRGFATATIVRL